MDFTLVNSLIFLFAGRQAWVGRTTAGKLRATFSTGQKIALASRSKILDNGLLGSTVDIKNNSGLRVDFG
jgi:hypothetical protein